MALACWLGVDSIFVFASSAPMSALRRGLGTISLGPAVLVRAETFGKLRRVISLQFTERTPRRAHSYACSEAISTL